MIPYFPPALTNRDPNQPPPSPWPLLLSVAAAILIAVLAQWL